MTKNLDKEMMYTSKKKDQSASEKDLEEHTKTERFKDKEKLDKLLFKQRDDGERLEDREKG